MTSHELDPGAPSRLQGPVLAMGLLGFLGGIAGAIYLNTLDNVDDRVLLSILVVVLLSTCLLLLWTRWRYG